MSERNQARKARIRYDYAPDALAETAIAEAMERWPGMTITGVLNYLVAAGWSALNHPQWTPPYPANRPTQVARPGLHPDFGSPMPR